MKQEQKEPFELFKVLERNEFRSFSFMEKLKDVQRYNLQCYFFYKEIDRLHKELNEAERKIRQYKPELEQTTRSEFIQIFINKSKA